MLTELHDDFRGSGAVELCGIKQSGALCDLIHTIWITGTNVGKKKKKAGMHKVGDTRNYIIYKVRTKTLIVVKWRRAETTSQPPRKVAALSQYRLYLTLTRGNEYVCVVNTKCAGAII